MAWSALTTPEVAVDAPASSRVMTKVKDDLDYLKALETRLPKAWAHWTNAGSVLHDHYNIASITATGLGVYEVVFTSALASADYTVVVNAGVFWGEAVEASLTTAGFTIGTEDHAGATGYADQLTFTVFGNF